MNWLTNVARPKIRSWFGTRDTPDNLWHKCSNCGEMIFHRDIKDKLYVCPSCDHHMRLSPEDRLFSLFGDQYQLIDPPTVVEDPLKFRDEKKYTDKLKEARRKTNHTDAIVSARGMLGQNPVVAAVQNFAFMGGSLGMAAGESILVAADQAIEHSAALIVFSASGGARMQEGALSLMQLPRTTIAVHMMREAKLPYIVVLTDPTSGGVTASYAMLGDVQIAEPGALIAFSGPRVIEQTIREKLPDGFQRAEFLSKVGMVDLVVHRHDMKDQLTRIVDLLLSAPGRQAKETAEAVPVAQPVDVEPIQPPVPQDGL